jgi:hypothetical protein
MTTIDRDTATALAQLIEYAGRGEGRGVRTETLMKPHVRKHKRTKVNVWRTECRGGPVRTTKVAPVGRLYDRETTMKRVRSL